MARLTEIDKAQIQLLIAGGVINATKHPELPLVIYNYSKSALPEHKFNPHVEMCRGMICDLDGNIVGRPFQKFYNYEELGNDECVIPKLPFELYDKIDGSLGILFWWHDNPHISTRGSFASDQALHATQLIWSPRYFDRINSLDRSKTYLFEIVYPEDPHVISYGDMDELVLLAIIDTETGEESDIQTLKDKFILPKRYDDVTDWKIARDVIPGDNREGFVIKFANNFRMKIKYAEFLRLQTIKHGLNEKAILENMMNGTIDDVMTGIVQLGEQQQTYFKMLIQKYEGIFGDIKETCLLECREDFPDRKAAAEYIKQQTFPDVLFRMYSRQDWQKAIWKYIWNNRQKYFEKQTEEQ